MTLKICKVKKFNHLNFKNKNLPHVSGRRLKADVRRVLKQKNLFF